MKLFYIIIILILFVFLGLLNSRKIFKKTDNKLVRNLVHSSLYLICCFSTLLFDHKLILIGTTLLSIVGSVVGVERKLLNRVSMGNRYRDYGIVFSGIGFLALILFFFDQKDIIIASLLIVGFADPMASLIGRTYGTKQITVWKNKKTLEGTLAFTVVAWLVLLSYVICCNLVSPLMLVMITAIALVLALVELFTPSFLDNFVLLVGGATLLRICTHI